MHPAAGAAGATALRDGLAGAPARATPSADLWRGQRSTIVRSTIGRTRGGETWERNRRVRPLAGVAGDVAIAGSLIFLLQQSRTGFRRSDSIINRLILFSLNTGLLTSLDAVMSLITITVLPTTFIYIMFFVTVSRCKLYFYLCCVRFRSNYIFHSIHELASCDA